MKGKIEFLNNNALGSFEFRFSSSWFQVPNSKVVINWA